MINLNNLQIPNQSSFDSSTDASFTKLQVVQDRLYTGSNKVANKDEFSSQEEINPVYTYTAGVLNRIDYASTNYKLFSYNVSGNPSVIDFVKGVVTYRKAFTYNPDATLAYITYSVI